jgi:hypothetical protein
MSPLQRVGCEFPFKRQNVAADFFPALLPVDYLRLTNFYESGCVQTGSLLAMV